MRRLALTVLVAALLVVPAVQAVADTSADAHAEAEAQTSAVLEPRGSIFIDREVGPTGFVLGYHPVTGEPIHNTAMGVRSGNGTAEAPYVISNWTITPTRGFGIKIEKTDVHVVLENIVVVGELATVGRQAGCATSVDSLECHDEHAFVLQDASNVTIQSVYATTVSRALAFERVQGVRVDTARFNLTASVDVPATHTTAPVGGTTFAGVSIRKSADVRLSNVTVTGDETPLFFYKVDGVTLDQSTIRGNPLPGLLEVASQVTTTENVTITRSIFNKTSINLRNSEGQETTSNFTLSRSLFPEGKKAIEVTGGTYEDIFVCGNTFRNLDADLRVISIGSGNRIDIVGNRFTNNTGNEQLGVEASNLRIERNILTRGDVLDQGLSTPSRNATVRYNHIEDTGGAHLSGDGINATNNWWGDASGPNVSGIEGPGEGEPLELFGADVAYDPWLEAPPKAGPRAVDCGVAEGPIGVQQGPGLAPFTRAAASLSAGVNEKVGPVHTNIHEQAKLGPLREATTPQGGLDTPLLEASTTADGSLTSILDVVDEVTRLQATDMGATIDEAPDQRASPRLTVALDALADRHGVRLDAYDHRAIVDLEQRSPVLASNLADVVTAFTRFEAAADAAFANADEPPTLDRRALSAASTVEPATRTGLAPDALANLLAHRAAFLRAVEALHTSTQDGAQPPAGSTVDACPAVLVDASRTDRTYATDCALVITLHGDSSYLNNAGGAGGTLAAAALVDLAGDDTYGSPTEPRCCGVNGGGYQAAGVLVDAAGNDTYHADARGVNGGGYSNGVGLLVDVEGQDDYLVGNDREASCTGDFCLAGAGSLGANGGGFAGVGTLVDGGGGDVFLAGVNASTECDGEGCLAAAGGAAVNGGGDLGSGALVSIGGSDVYEAGTNATARCHGKDCLALPGGEAVNGGAFLGAGHLVDTAGDDRYDAGVNASGICSGIVCAAAPGSNGVNGAAEGGIGRLIDLEGTDVYRARTGTGTVCEEVCDYGRWNGDEGLLLDAQGTGDRYEDPELSCTDCSRLPRGRAGALLDLTSSPAGTHARSVDGVGG